MDLCFLELPSGIYPSLLWVLEDVSLCVHKICWIFYHVWDYGFKFYALGFLSVILIVEHICRTGGIWWDHIILVLILFLFFHCGVGIQVFFLSCMSDMKFKLIFVELKFHCLYLWCNLVAIWTGMKLVGLCFKSLFWFFFYWEDWVVPGRLLRISPVGWKEPRPKLEWWGSTRSVFN